MSLVNNTLRGEMLQVTGGQSAADRGLAEAVIHFSFVMQALRDHKLLQPLHSLITDAGSMAVCIHSSHLALRLFSHRLLAVFTARRSYASTVLGVVILSVSPSVTCVLCD